MNIPAEDAVITFQTVPTGSYASPGIAYRVHREGRTVHIRRVEGDSATSDPTWAYRQAKWTALDA